MSSESLAKEINDLLEQIGELSELFRCPLTIEGKEYKPQWACAIISEEVGLDLYPLFSNPTDDEICMSTSLSLEEATKLRDKLQAYSESLFEENKNNIEILETETLCIDTVNESDIPDLVQDVNRVLEDLELEYSSQKEDPEDALYQIHYAVEIGKLHFFICRVEIIEKLPQFIQLHLREVETREYMVIVVHPEYIHAIYHNFK